MATKNAEADEKAKVDAADDVKDTTEPVPAGTQTTSDKPADTPDEVQEVEADDEYDYEDFDNAVKDDSLGSVREGGYDVPWTYLTPEHFGEDGYKARTADTDDEDVVKWNVQQAFETENDDEVVALVAVQATPGQTFTVDELPEWDSLVKAGIDPVQYLSGLPVRASVEGGGPRKGIPA